MGVLTKAEARDLYDDLSSKYDRLMRSFSLLGVERQRRRLIGQLGLGDGDTVADLCCGTGANLSYLREAVGPTGTIIGVDLSRGMLDRAQTKIDEAGWDIRLASRGTTRISSLGWRRAAICIYAIMMSCCSAPHTAASL